MIIDLDWLLPAPADFRDRLKALRAWHLAGEPVAEPLHALACHRLDLNQLGQLGRLAGAIDAPAGLARLRLGLVGAGTLDLLADAIAGSALRHRVLATLVTGDYGIAVRDCIDPASRLRDQDLDALLIALDHHSLGLDAPRMTAATAEAAVAEALATLMAMVEGAGKIARGSVMVATLVAPPVALFGSFDAVLPGSVPAMVAAVNAGLVAMARAGQIMLVDFAGAAAMVGGDRWHDPRQWHMAKLMIAPDALPLAGDMVARVLAAVRGTTRKCLVLDLDNTLWGGVIGDDGVEGIAIGQGSATGEAFLAIQQLALQLRQRGIVLAVCFKNDESVARAPFRDHPDMLLREEHFAVFVANWGDKATNLRAIAAALNIGLDALVLLDDNPAERAQVRQELPMVAVPELGDDPARYPRLLAAAGYFEAIGIWHGAGWTFIAFGVMHAVYICTNEAWRERRKLKKRALKKAGVKIADPGGLEIAGYHLLTLVAVMLGNVMFRADSVGDAVSIWAAMARVGGAGAAPGAELLLTIIIAALIVALAPNTQQIMRRYDPAHNWRDWANVAPSRFDWTWTPSPLGILLAGLTLSIGIAFIQRGAAVFLYFNF